MLNSLIYIRSGANVLRIALAERASLRRLACKQTELQEQADNDTQLSAETMACADEQSRCMLSFLSGNTFTGDVADGALHGTGLYKWAGGAAQYEGSFHCNEITGHGVSFNTLRVPDRLATHSAAFLVRNSLYGHTLPHGRSAAKPEQHKRSVWAVKAKPAQLLCRFTPGPARLHTKGRCVTACATGAAGWCSREAQPLTLSALAALQPVLLMTARRLTQSNASPGKAVALLQPRNRAAPPAPRLLKRVPRAAALQARRSV